MSVTWHYTNSYNTGERTVEIVYGQGEDAAQFTSAGPIEVGAETTTSVQFTVDADGDYQIALHDTSSGSFLDATSVTAFAIAEVEGTGGGDEPAAELPYSVNWVDGSVSDLAGWSAYSVAGETEFVYNAMPEYEVWFGAVCGGTSCEIDDYLISPMLPFEAGKNYKITVTLNYNYAKDIDVMTGTSLDDTGWTSIGKLEDCSQGAVNELVFTATGEQRIALHAVSAAGVGDCQIAAVSIAETDEQPGGGDEPVEALAVPQDWSFAGSAEAGWTVVNGSEYAQSYWYPSDEGMMIQAQVMSSVDSYLVSPYLALEAGQSYEVTVDWHENSTGTHTINLLYGTGDELADFADAGSVDMVAGGSDKLTFTATEAGNYRITLHSSTYTQFDGAGQAWVSAIHIATAQGGGEPTTGLPIPQEWSFSNTLADWTVENLDDSGSTGEWSAGANGGIYYRLPPFTALGFKEDGVLVNRGLDYMRVISASAGANWHNRERISASLELFYKHYSNIPLSVADGIPLTCKGNDYGTVGDERLVSSAVGRSYGVEMMARWQIPGRLNVVGSATVYSSEYRSGRKRKLIDSAWDNRFVINVSGTYDFKRGWSVGAKVSAIGGAPYTPYDVALSSLVEAWDATGRPYYDYTRYNSERLGAFAQLDIRADKVFYFKRWMLGIYVDLQNVTFSKIKLPDVLVSTGVIENPTAPPAEQRYVMKSIKQESGTIIPTIGITAEF